MNMRILFSFLLILSTAVGLTQISAEKTTHDFGDLYANAQTYVDIKFTNNTDKKQFLLTIDKPRDVYYIFSSKVLLPDSSITVRLKINDGRRGRFNHEIDLYFSDSNDPITVRLTGNVKEAAQNPLTDCPDFDNTPPKGGRYEFEITVKVIDSLTHEPIRRSKVYFVQNNTLVATYYTNKDGIIHRPFPMGYYFITAEKETYQSNYKEGYLNFQRNYVEIELQRPPVETEPPVIDEPDTSDLIVVVIDDPEPEVAEVVETPEPDTVVVPEVEEPPVVVDNTPLHELPDTLFDLAHFKLNNITFILDVSSSMNSSGKLDLLKLSMVELAEVLRPNDMISVIKYSSSVSVILDKKSGTDKEEIIEKVNGLKTSSSTAGGDAIKAAYRLNNSVYSADRNNIVIMITDGAFNKGSKAYQEIIDQNYRKKGIIFSVVGIKTSSYITEHMQNVVNKGGGDFIEIRTVEDAKTKLIKEIKRTSFRGR